jgi:hypothetical protein
MTESIIKIPKPVVIKTPQSIVHIKHNISLRQYKYWVLLLRFYREFFEAGEKPDQKGFYSVPIAKIADYIGYEPVKTELKPDFEALRKEPIIINFLDKDGKKATHGMGFISEWKITSKTIAFRIPSFIEDVMQGDSETKNIFQLLNWNIFNSFNGKYEAIIYKLCKDYIGVKNTPYMTISEYREYIGLRENEYTEMRNFTRRCITNPIASINKNELSDIEVSVEYRRSGRKVEGLYFKVKERKQTAIPFPEFEPHKAFAFAKVSISVQDQHKYLETMLPEEIEATIERSNEWAEDLKKQGKKVQMGAIYNKAFLERWGIQFLDQKQVENEIKAKELEKKKTEQAKIQAEKEDEKNKEIRIKTIFAKFEELPDSEKKAMIETSIEKAVGMEKDLMNKAYSKFGIESCKNSSPFRGLFLGFLKEKIDY